MPEGFGAPIYIYNIYIYKYIHIYTYIYIYIYWPGSQLLGLEDPSQPSLSSHTFVCVQQFLSNEIMLHHLGVGLPEDGMPLPPTPHAP